MGAKVTGICSTRNVDLLREIGSESVVDYTRVRTSRTGDERYDVIFDLVGNRPLAESEARAASDPGVFIACGGGGGDIGWSSTRGHGKATGAGVVYEPAAGRDSCATKER